MSVEKFYPTKYAGYYVTEDGRVFRDPVKKSDGKNRTEKVELNFFLRGGAGVSNKQYPSVNISIKNSEGRTLYQKKEYVHRLVAEALVDNPHNYSEIDHIDRDKLNNCVSNLRWCDRKSNQQNIIIRGKNGRFV